MKQNISLPFIHSLFILCIFLFLTSSCGEGELEWKEIHTVDGSKPSPRHECGMIAIKDKLYLLGGRGKMPVEVYDPALNIWTKRSSPPLEIHHFQPITYNGYIVLLGAMTGPFPVEKPLSHMVIYNPDTDKWIIGDSIPTERVRGAGGTVIHNDKFYWIGGIVDGHGGGHSAYFDVYDPVSRSWKMLPDAPQARDHFEAVILNEKLYVVGGGRAKAAYGLFDVVIPEIEVYDFLEGRWSVVEPHIPTPRTSTATGVWRNKIILVGGADPINYYGATEVELFETQSQTWKILPDLPIGRHGLGLSIIGNKLFVSSGKPIKREGHDLGDLWELNLDFY